jgi:hypothetical protein
MPMTGCVRVCDVVCAKQRQLPAWNRQLNGRQDRGQFGGVAREVGRVIRVILCVGHDVIRKDPSHVVLKIHDEIDERLKKAGRQLHVAVIGEHGGFAEETRAQCHAGRVELRQVHLHDIMLPDKFVATQPNVGARRLC